MWNPQLCNGTVLAYLGDAVLEVLARETVLDTGIQDVGKLNALAASFVRATSQSDAVDRILPHLTEEELTYFKRGRNTGKIAAPKSASMAQYRRATGLEALFGFLYLTEQVTRMRELFSLAYPKETKEENT